MTAPCSTSILHPATNSIYPASAEQQSLLPQAYRVNRRLVVTTKEQVVGTEQDDDYAARRAALEQLFHALPPPDTADYWRQIEDITRETALPLEVLCHCLRERWEAGAESDAERIFTRLLLGVQPTIQFWARRFAGQSSEGQGLKLAEDIEQECYVALWQELASGKRTFLFENTQHALKRIVRHRAQAIMEQEGLWKRPDVTQPTRIPRRTMESIDASRETEEGSPLDNILADPLPTDERELLLDLQQGLEHLEQLDTTSRQIIYWYYYGGYTQQDIAERLHTTDRTVRDRIKKILAELRRYLGSEEEHRG